ncbi:MAG: hypothetical protein H6594_04305 [Flavobacteriales bacterium]|nr:hypothetical protein [Flavobacteriales bacterium]
MEQLQRIHPRDLIMLLQCDPRQLLGRIVQLNRASRYRNTLNAIVLAAEVNELRDRADRPTGPNDLA